MGIFGFLSKAHLDQSVPSSDIAANVALIDEKIKTERDNIEASKKALQQLDAAVDQTMARSTTEQGAGRAAQLRRTQAKERTTLQTEIAAAQKKITALNEERAPIAKNLRAVEAEVGPIKYIASFIYGENPDANLLEKAVTWIIITIIFVFDPLAILMILAAQMSFQWWRDERRAELEKQPTTEEKIKIDPHLSNPVEYVDSAVNEPVYQPPAVTPVQDSTPTPEPKVEDVQVPETPPKVPPVVESAPVMDDVSIEDEAVSDSEKEAMRRWKDMSSTNNIHNAKALYKQGIISQLPWLEYVEQDLKAKADNIESDSKKKLT
jgi:hypothetical protein